MDRTTKIMVDSGASANFVSKEFLVDIFRTPVGGAPASVRLADGTCGRISGEIIIGTYDEFLPFKIMPLSDSFDAILGQPWLTTVNPLFQLETGIHGNSRDSG